MGYVVIDIRQVEGIRMAPKDPGPRLTASIRDIAGPRRARYFAAAARGEPVEITNRGHEYVTMVATAHWRRAHQAETIVQTLRRLARRNAPPAEYAAVAQLLSDLSDAEVLIDDTEEELAIA
jgi:antitoxin (DNA-binding transcriptional repressor) of toxin-antitoxin stability system